MHSLSRGRVSVFLSLPQGCLETHHLLPSERAPADRSVARSRAHELVLFPDSLVNTSVLSCVWFSNRPRTHIYSRPSFRGAKRPGEIRASQPDVDDGDVDVNDEDEDVRWCGTRHARLLIAASINTGEPRMIDNAGRPAGPSDRVTGNNDLRKFPFFRAHGLKKRPPVEFIHV